MKYVLFLCCAMTMVACKTEPKINYALLSGKVTNATTDKVTVYSVDFDQEISIKPDGTFADTLKLTEPGFYDFSIGREVTKIYLKHGDVLNISVDQNLFDETIKYSGKGAVENNYLATKQQNNEKHTDNSQELYLLDEQAFKTKVEELKQSNASLLSELIDADPNFIADETKNLEYDSYSLLTAYEGSHKYYTKNEEFTVSETFLPEALKQLTFDDSKAYKNSSSYKNMAFRKVLDTIFDTIGEDYQNASTEHLKTITEIQIPALKNDVIRYLGSFLISPGNPNMESVYTFFTNNVTDSKIKENLDATYAKGKDLVRGKPSPQFTNYENHKGGTLSLADLKGKYVYIDVWATWCGPCKREIPYLKEVETQFHGKNIEFVSTSIDVAKDHDKWDAMVRDMQLGGVQLFADNDWKSQFVTDYAIEGIPRFILVDPDGNIISADAPRPSNPKLVELFNSLKI
ncbi:TlpA family protein disulfide reductase [Geojedonia litorea]|uniref:TlpA family protein disulfide reductase n=1 Tax=Geojedonia litorea TaxID=1268269 RepID=A0ABV9N7I9_9FLAO